jgi:hypothetical protein
MQISLWIFAGAMFLGIFLRARSGLRRYRNGC